MSYNLNEAFKDLNNLWEDFEEEEEFEVEEPVEDVEENNTIPDAEVEVRAVVEEEPTDPVSDNANNVMAAYQNANKWLDSVKEAIYTRMNCPFFSSYVHNLAHTMPERFDKFGDILHTVNMEIPYPATEEIAKKPDTIQEAFDIIFSTLDNIKAALNGFISATDKDSHGMSCAAEVCLNNIEEEYPMLYRLKAKADECKEDTITFDKFVGQYVEHKGDLLENLNEDTEKVKNNKWVNRGEEGTHGTFRTKKEADAQRKAMFANGYKAESLTEDTDYIYTCDKCGNSISRSGEGYSVFDKNNVLVGYIDADNDEEAIKKLKNKQIDKVDNSLEEGIFGSKKSKAEDKTDFVAYDYRPKKNKELCQDTFRIMYDDLKDVYIVRNKKNNKWLKKTFKTPDSAELYLDTAKDELGNPLYEGIFDFGSKKSKSKINSSLTESVNNKETKVFMNTWANYNEYGADDGITPTGWMSPAEAIDYADEYAEYEPFINDIDAPIDLGINEYTGLSVLETLYEMEDEDIDYDILEAIINDGYSLEDAVEKVINQEYMYMDGVKNDYDLGYATIEELGGIEFAVANPEYYIDEDAIRNEVETSYDLYGMYEEQARQEIADELNIDEDEVTDSQIEDWIYNNNIVENEVQAVVDGIESGDIKPDDYFDYEAFGRDLRFDGWTYTGKGAILVESKK